MAYLFDADVFIRAKNLHYGFDFCPAFWDWLVAAGADGRAVSIERVGDELAAGDDDLATWAAERGGDFFLRPTPDVFTALGVVSRWVTGQQYEPAAVSTFLQVADYYLVAHALAHGYDVVTHEIASPSTRRIKIPNVCIGIGVKCMTPFEMLRGARAVRARSTLVSDRPAFIDNRDGNTLARALREVLAAPQPDRPREGTAPPDHVRIATAFFSPSGFVQIAGVLSRVPEVRLLLGADRPADEPASRRALGEPAGAFEQRRLGGRLRRMDDGLRRERDRLPYTRTSATALRTLIAALRGGNMEVRRYERAFLHAKAYILTSGGDAFGAPEGVIAGSANLTAAGLSDNLELNLGRYDRPIVERARAWFDELWEQAEPYDLADVFEVVFRPRRPWEIFIHVLWRLYGNEVADDAAVDDNLPLTSFQKHGVARALRLIRETGGCIVADEVGLGKTFVAGEILQIYRERRQRALLICPAALRDTTWKKFLSTYQLFVECLSFEQLASDRQLRDAQRPEARQQHLQRPLGEYQLVIVDEAHNYRNPDAPTRAAALRALMFGRRRDLLLLTATPVNNSLWDLYHLIRFFLRQDAHLAERGILSLRARFEEAMREDPSSLSPDVLYPVMF